MEFPIESFEPNTALSKIDESKIGPGILRRVLSARAEMDAIQSELKREPAEKCDSYEEDLKHFGIDLG